MTFQPGVCEARGGQGEEEVCPHPGDSTCRSPGWLLRDWVGDRSGAGTAEDREEGKASCQRPVSLFGEFGLQSNRELWRDRGSGVTW